MAAPHFSVNRQAGTTIRSWQNFTALDWLHFFGRFLVCLYFLHALLFNLSHIDEVAEQLTATNLLPPDAVLPAVLAGVAVAFIGSALFFTACDPVSFLLLPLFLLPQTAIEHVLPLFGLKSDTEAFHAHVVSILHSVALIGGLLVIYSHTVHIAWLETEQKAEIRRAMEAWYEKKDKEAAGGAAEVEQKREPKKIK